MLSPRKKCIYGTVFGLAAIGFVVDRIIGPGPEEAGAKEPSAVSAKAAAPAPVAAPATGKSTSARNEPSVVPESAGRAAQEIRRLPDIAEVRDLFRATPPTSPTSETEQAREEKAEADVVAEFIAGHRLEGTFDDGTIRVAMVNGRTLRPGQVLGGFRLERVEAYQAVFQKDGREAVLALPGTEAGPETKGGRG